MFDLKQYSIKECLEYAIYGNYNYPLVIGTNIPKADSNLGKLNYFSQYYTYNNFPFMAYSTYSNEYNSNKEFEFAIKSDEQNQYERSYYLHYIHRRFEELLELKNIGFAYKIKKDGTKYLTRKRYEFKDRTLRMDILHNEYTWYYKSHRYMIKLNKNKTSEHFIHFKKFNVDIRENYNSKGVCTRSLLHLNDGRSIQMHLKNGVVSCFCQSFHGSLKQSTIKIPYLSDASVLNLYTQSNCFNLDLLLPDNELYITYTSSLRILKQCVQNCVMNDEFLNPVLRTMLNKIKEYEIQD